MVNVELFKMPVTDHGQMETVLLQVETLRREGKTIPAEVQDWADFANNQLLRASTK